MRKSLALVGVLSDGNSLPDFGFFDAAGHTMRLNHGTGVTLPVESFQSFDNAHCASGICDGFLAVGTSNAVPGFNVVQAVVAFETDPTRHGDSLPGISELAAN